MLTLFEDHPANALVSRHDNHCSTRSLLNSIIVPTRYPIGPYKNNVATPKRGNYIIFSYCEKAAISRAIAQATQWPGDRHASRCIRVVLFLISIRGARSLARLLVPLAAND